MTYYQNIKLFPDSEIDIAFLRNKLYSKLHKAIVDLKATDIGISFPQANGRLGCVIRIHSSKERLEQLQNLNWLGGLSGYCKTSDVLSVPDTINGYQTISRIRQTKTETKLKRLIKYKKKEGFLKTDDDVKTYIKQYKEKMFKTSLDNPYLELHSTSTGNKYPLYIAFGELQKTPEAGVFNNFGLSKTATVPIF